MFLCLILVFGSFGVGKGGTCLVLFVFTFGFVIFVLFVVLIWADLGGISERVCFLEISDRVFGVFSCLIVVFLVYLRWKRRWFCLFLLYLYICVYVIFVCVLFDYCLIWTYLGGVFGWFYDLWLGFGYVLMFYSSRVEKEGFCLSFFFVSTLACLFVLLFNSSNLSWFGWNFYLVFVISYRVFWYVLNILREITWH